jgi:hypothetical protein
MPWGRENSTAPAAWRDEDRTPFLGFRRENGAQLLLSVPG